MGVDVETIKPGDGANFPSAGQKDREFSSVVHRWARANPFLFGGR